MAHKVLRFANREAWLEARKGGIGASDAATIVGLNPYETPYQLWRRRLGLDDPKEYTFLMQAGHYLEDAVSLFFQDQTGNQIIKSSAPDFMYVNPDKDFLRVSPDRTYWLAGQPHNEGNKGILECKTTQRAIDADDIPKHWFCQVQMNLGVAELTHGSLAWLTQGRSFGYCNLQFVPDFYLWMIEKIERFWVDCIVGGQEPQIANAKDAILKYNLHTGGKIVEVDVEVYDAYCKLKEIRAEIAALEERKAEKEEQLKMVFEDAEAIAFKGETLATWKSPKASKKFNLNRFKVEHPELVEDYMEEVEASRRFLLK